MLNIESVIYQFVEIILQNLLSNNKIHKISQKILHKLYDCITMQVCRYFIPILYLGRMLCPRKVSRKDFRSACLRTEIFVQELTLSSTLNPNPKTSHPVDPQLPHKLLFYLY